MLTRLVVIVFPAIFYSYILAYIRLSVTMYLFILPVFFHTDILYTNYSLNFFLRCCRLTELLNCLLGCWLAPRSLLNNFSVFYPPLREWDPIFFNFPFIFFIHLLVVGSHFLIFSFSVFYPSFWRCVPIFSFSSVSCGLVSGTGFHVSQFQLGCSGFISSLKFYPTSLFRLT